MRKRLGADVEAVKRELNGIGHLEKAYMNSDGLSITKGISIMPKTLLKNVLEPLPLGSIRPEGWLRNQLRIQADGLSGPLDEFWPDIAESGWIGGSAEGWERGSLLARRHCSPGFSAR